MKNEELQREKIQREEMVSTQIERRGIKDTRLLKALREVPRHEFVPEASRESAYQDRPIPIGNGQTISQPYIVALMVELCGLGTGEKVLEIGTGSGYAAAILSRLAETVYTIERDRELCMRASTLLRTKGYENIQCIEGDGYEGYEAAAPYDAVLLSAAPAEIPKPLLNQLKDGGRLVGPVGGGSQYLVRVVRAGDEFSTTKHGGVRFVPMV